MTEDNSRKIPTLQAQSVGNFLLADHPIKSDKSAMGTVAEIRATIRDILSAKGTGAVAVVTAMKAEGLTSVDRTYLADFLRNKKATLSYDFTQELADFLQIDAQSLRIKKAAPPPDIRKGSQPRYLVTQHMEARGLDDAQVAARIDGIAPETIKTWRESPEKLVEWQLQALRHAFDLDHVDQIARAPVTSVRKKPPIAGRKARKSA